MKTPFGWDTDPAPDFSRTWVGTARLHPDTDPAAIRARHRAEVRQAAAALGTADPAVLGDWLVMPAWTVRRHLEGLGLVEPTPATRRPVMTSADLKRPKPKKAPKPPPKPKAPPRSRRKDRGDPPPGFRWGCGGRPQLLPETARAVAGAVAAGGTYRAVAARFGIGAGSVTRAVRRFNDDQRRGEPC